MSLKVMEENESETEGSRKKMVEFNLNSRFLYLFKSA